jgi:hypothetical protein
MARLTITLSDQRHQQLRLRAASRGKTIGEVIEESLAAADEANRARLMELNARARANAARTMAGLTDDEIEAWVLDEISGRHNGDA